MELDWYACYTRSRHEKLVVWLLAEHGIECYLPLLPRRHRWKDRSRIVRLPLFPSYVFARFPMSSLPSVLRTTGVCTIIRSNDHPVVVPNDEIQNIRRFVAALEAEAGNQDVRPERTKWFKEGKLVEFTDGPFKGVRGVIRQLRNRRRVIVGIEATGQGVEVNVERYTLRPVRRRRRVGEGSR